MTQEELAKDCGLSVTALAMIERRERSPLLETVVAIATALDCTIDELCEP
jgi:transcriptional regulator with XRE-family HTH domain